MDISYVSEFVILADVKNYSAAAYQLHMSQSALSRHIQTMEKELGHPLLTRTTRNVELTEYGKLYLPYARRIAAEVRKADRTLHSYESKVSGKLQIGITHHPDLYNITDFIIGFRRQHPDISLQLIEGSLKELRREFQKGNLHIMTMTYADWEKPNNPFIPAGKSQLVATLPETHPLAAYEKIPHHCLENIQLLLPSQYTYTYQYLDHVLSQKEIHPDIIYHGIASGIGDFLKEGMGILIQDQILAGNKLEAPLVIRELDPNISYIYGLEYSKKLTPQEKMFVNYIEKILCFSD